jgi:hypothetical protein
MGLVFGLGYDLGLGFGFRLESRLDQTRCPDYSHCNPLNHFNHLALTVSIKIDLIPIK